MFSENEAFRHILYTEKGFVTQKRLKTSDLLEQ